ncbi:MAG: aspartate aminotransferase family protein [Pirellulales bacterium]
MNPAEYPNSVRLHRESNEVLATGVASSMRRHATPIPLYFERADGPYFYDVDGHRLLDYTLAWGPLIVGSNHPRLNTAVAEQLKRGYTFGAQHGLELEVASKITQLVPGVQQVVFSNTGSEAVQAAIRIARAYTGREQIVKFEGHYHGWMNNVLVSYHPSESRPSQCQPSCGGQPASEYAHTFVLPWNDLPALEELLADRGSEIACVFTEPLLANSGCCEPASGYLDRIVELCRRHAIVSVFDEVITGFRVALGGARERYGVEPDLSVYGKAIAGGFSLSAVGGRAQVFEALRDGRTIHAGTYNGNPICLAAASATLDILAAHGTYPAMRQHGIELRKCLAAAAARHGQRLVTCGDDVVFAMHFGLERAPRNYSETLGVDVERFRQFQSEMLARSVYLLPDGRWYIGTQHDSSALEIALNAIEESMRELAK